MPARTSRSGVPASSAPHTASAVVERRRRPRTPTAARTAGGCRLVEQVVAPVDRAAQRPLALGQVARARRRAAPSRSFEAREHRRRREEPRRGPRRARSRAAGRRGARRSRPPPSAFSAVSANSGRTAVAALDEQPHRLARPRESRVGRGRSRSGRPGRGERRDGELLLARRSGAARGWTRSSAARGAAQELGHDRGAAPTTCSKLSRTSSAVPVREVLDDRARAASGPAAAGRPRRRSRDGDERRVGDRRRAARTRRRRGSRRRRSPATCERRAASCRCRPGR